MSEDDIKENRYYIQELQKKLEKIYDLLEDLIWMHSYDSTGMVNDCLDKLKKIKELSGEKRSVDDNEGMMTSGSCTQNPAGADSKLEERIKRIKPALDVLGKKETTDQDIWDFINLIEKNITKKYFDKIESFRVKIMSENNDYWAVEFMNDILNYQRELRKKIND